MERSTGDRNTGDGAATSDALRQQGAAMASQARDMAGARAEEAREGAAERAATAGSALHRAADELGDDPMGSMMAVAADQLDSVSQRLRQGDLRSLADDVEAFARRQPALFIGGAVAIGLALGRFATARPVPPQAHHHDDDEPAPEPPGQGREGRPAEALSAKAPTGEPDAVVPGRSGPGARPQHQPRSGGSIPPSE